MPIDPSILSNFLSILGLGNEEGETVSRMPGLNIGRHATSRIGKTPITFSPNEIYGGQFSGEFDPNSNSILVDANEGRSPRQVKRTVVHEDLHSLFEQLGQEDLTHSILKDPNNPDASILPEDIDPRILKLIEMFGRADSN